MNAKAKGSRNEHRTMKLLESMGYSCTRAAASLGAFDVIAIGATDIVLVQCKTRDWPSRVELEALKLFPAPPNAKKLVHRYRDRVRLPDVKELSPMRLKLWNPRAAVSAAKNLASFGPRKPGTGRQRGRSQRKGEK